MKPHTIILNQPFGVGDFLFCLSIANDFIDDGYKVIWPVESCYAPLSKHFPGITMLDKALLNIDYERKDEYELNGVRVIPLRFSDSLCKVPYTQCMQSKYLFFNEDWHTWKDKVIIKRSVWNEKKLYSEVLGLHPDEKYNLISQTFGLRASHGVTINVDNGLRNVYMSVIDGFTLIDWLTVMENATTIHAVASSNIYLFELFDMKAEKIDLYIRRPIERNHDNYSYILEKRNYVFHD
jgi:hypothetical protein